MRAVVDIGSNSVKYLMGDVFRGAPRILGHNSRVTRLAEKMDKNGGFLEKTALERTEAALKSFSKELINAQIEIVATAAARKAKNSDELAKIVKATLGSPMRIISGDEEAEWSQRGARIAARAALGEDESLAFIDMGGASTEISFSEENSVRHSFPVGSVAILEKLGLDEMPTSDDTWTQAKKAIPNFFEKAILNKLTKFSKSVSDRKSVAVGGTLVISARLACQDPARISEYGIRCFQKELRDVNERIRRLSREERLALPHMEKGREDLTCGGLLALDFLMENLGSREIFITPWGLRHGILFGEK